MKVISWLEKNREATEREVELPFMELAPSYLGEIARTVAQRCYDAGIWLGQRSTVCVKVDQEQPRRFNVFRSTVVIFRSEEAL